MSGAVREVAAGVVHHLRLLALRQSALPPVLVHLLVLAVLYSADAGPPVPAGALSAALLVPVAAWLHRLAATAESAPFADVSAVRLGGPVRRGAARLLAGLVVGAALAVVSVVWAVLANPHPYPPRTVALLLGLHLVQAAAGAGLGSCVSPPLRVPVGAAVLAVAGWTVGSLALPWLPPAGPVLAAFAVEGAGGGAAPGGGAGGRWAAVAAALGFAAATAAAGAVLGARRAR